MKLLFNKYTMNYLHDKAIAHSVDVDNPSTIKLFLEVSQTFHSAWHTYLEAGFKIWGSYQ